MKLKVKQIDFLEGIQKVLSIIPTRTTLAILSNILLDAKEGEMNIAATDLDISISTKIPVEVEQPGSISVPAKKFTELLRELPNTELVLELEDERVWVKSERGRYGLMGLPAEDFPRLPSGIEGVVISPEGEVLAEMIRKTSFTVSTDESRPALTGVLFKTDGQKVTLAATDGHRLSQVSKTIPESISPFEVIIPPKALNHLTTLISGNEQLKRVVVGETYILFDLEKTRLFSRLIEGPYPDIERVIPQTNNKKLVVDNEIFSSAVRRVAALSDSDTHQVCFSLKKGLVRLSATSHELGGEATEEVDVEYDDEEMDIGYNANYVLGILKRMQSPRVIFQLDTPISASIVRPVEQPEDEDYFCLLMPLRLTD